MSNAHGVVIKNGVLLEWKTCDRYVRIPDTVKIIGQNAIPKGAETVEIPNSVIEIGEGAFCGCYNLERIVIPESVTKIGSRSFSGCESLCSVVIENGDVEIGESAFVDCEKLADANGFVIVKDILFNYFGCRSSSFAAIDNPHERGEIRSIWYGIIVPLRRWNSSRCPG